MDEDKAKAIATRLGGEVTYYMMHPHGTHVHAQFSKFDSASIFGSMLGEYAKVRTSYSFVGEDIVAECFFK